MIKKVKTTRIFFGIVILINMIIFFLMRYNAYKNICIVIDDSFQESIIIDYNNRTNKERISSSLWERSHGSSCSHVISSTPPHPLFRTTAL